MRTRHQHLAFAWVTVGALILCSIEPPAVRSASSTSKVVTAEIQAGIEKHIEEQAREGGGFFRFTSDSGQFSFKLVRVHTEYLSRLGPRRHFACVDLVDTGGDVYDVDFFLEGDPDSMRVVETTLHKLNGRPFYAWKQQEDKTWKRVPADPGTQKLLEIVEDRDAFEFTYKFALPSLKAPARLWLPCPQSDSFQRVTLVSVKAPKPHRVLDEAEHGNRILFFELEPRDGGRAVTMRFRVDRAEKAAYASTPEEAAAHLQPERLVPSTENFESIAREVVGEKKGDLVRARALYDHVIERMRYMKFGDGYGKGDAVYACDARSGNCTDYHAYFIALARSIGIPARFAIGAAIPASREDGGIDGYHCWIEFFAEGKWWPVDISEADKYTALATYFFGHHPANRFEFSRGRDLVVEPGPAAGPINFLAYPVLEVAGKPVKIVPQFSFVRI